MSGGGGGGGRGGGWGLRRGRGLEHESDPRSVPRCRPGGLGPVSVAVGATSFAFHASYTFAGQVLDYAGMFLLIGWALARGLMRARPSERERRASLLGAACSP